MKRHRSILSQFVALSVLLPVFALSVRAEPYTVAVVASDDAVLAEPAPRTGQLTRDQVMSMVRRFFADVTRTLTGPVTLVSLK